MARSPLCRTCGKPIPKRTETVRFGQSAGDCAKWPAECRPDRPVSRLEAQRLVNGEIVSVRYSERASITNAAGTAYVSTAVPRYVGEVGVWFGQYRDRFFCRGECARAFAYFALENPGHLVAKAYADAMEAQRT